MGVQRTTASIDDFFAALPIEQGTALRALDAAIAPVFEGHERVLWEGPFWGGTQQRILGYGVYTYRGRSGASGEWFIVAIAAQKDHLSLYVSGAEDGTPIVKLHGPRLGKVKIGSGVATFKRLDDIAMETVIEIATRARDSLVAS